MSVPRRPGSWPASRWALAWCSAWESVSPWDVRKEASESGKRRNRDQFHLRSGRAGPLLIDLRSEHVPEAERQRNLHAGVVREDITVPVVVDLHADADDPAFSDEHAHPHEVLKREVSARIQTID